MDVEPQAWRNCPLVSIDADVVHGEPCLKERAYMELRGQSEDEPIVSALESFPTTPGGAAAIPVVLAYR